MVRWNCWEPSNSYYNVILFYAVLRHYTYYTLCVVWIVNILFKIKIKKVKKKKLYALD